MPQASEELELALLPPPVVAWQVSEQPERALLLRVPQAQALLSGQRFSALQASPEGLRAQPAQLAYAKPPLPRPLSLPSLPLL